MLTGGTGETKQMTLTRALGTPSIAARLGRFRGTGIGPGAETALKSVSTAATSRREGALYLQGDVPYTSAMYVGAACRGKGFSPCQTLRIGWRTLYGQYNE